MTGCIRLPSVRTVPPDAVERLQNRLAIELFWRHVDKLNDQPAPKRDPIPRYLRVVVDDDFCGPIG